MTFLTNYYYELPYDIIMRINSIIIEIYKNEHKYKFNLKNKYYKILQVGCHFPSYHNYIQRLIELELDDKEEYKEDYFNSNIFYSNFNPLTQELYEINTILNLNGQFLVGQGYFKNKPKYNFPNGFCSLKDEIEGVILDKKAFSNFYPCSECGTLMPISYGCIKSECLNCYINYARNIDDENNNMFDTKKYEDEYLNVEDELSIGYGSINFEEIVKNTCKLHKKNINLLKINNIPLKKIGKYIKIREHINSDDLIERLLYKLQ